MARGKAIAKEILSGNSINANMKETTGNIRMVINPDNKNFNSFVKFMAEMVEKYGNDVLPQLNDSDIK